jgi:hypothetical protein
LAEFAIKHKVQISKPHKVHDNQILLYGGSYSICVKSQTPFASMLVELGDDKRKGSGKCQGCCLPPALCLLIVAVILKVIGVHFVSNCLLFIAALILCRMQLVDPKIDKEARKKFLKGVERYWGRASLGAQPRMGEEWDDILEQMGKDK